MQIVVAPQALSAEVNGETVILAPDMKYIRLDGTGGVIWELVNSGATFDAILDSLCEQYDVDRQTVQRDVMAFLHDLAAKGVLTLR